MKKTLLRYYHTLKYLKWQQIFYRGKKYLPQSYQVPQLHEALRSPKFSWVRKTSHQRYWHNKHTLLILNKTIPVDTPPCWTRQDIDPLYHYHLHYFHCLQGIDKATYHEENRALIEAWIQSHPYAGLPAFDPYPLSLRLVNWIKFHQETQALSTRALITLQEQAYYLSRHIEWHLLGNHLFVNAKALIFAGLFFQGKKASAWYETGMRILKKQLKEQITQDGGHFELSPFYHALILDDILDLINIHQTYGIQPPLILSEKVSPMIHWLETLSHPDGYPAFFNDTICDQDLTPEALRAYANQLGLIIEPFNKQSPLLQKDAYYRLTHHELTVFFDAANIGADYIPGHAHADTLSLEVSWKHHRVFVNTGTSTYHDTIQREYERSTKAHNTLSIDGLNSSEVWSKFRVARRAKINTHFSSHDHERTIAKSAHNGFSYQLKKCVHERGVILENNQLIIEDMLFAHSDKQHTIKTYFHCHPEIKLHKTSKSIIHIYRQDTPIALFHIPHNTNCEILKTHWSPDFNRQLPNETIELSIFTQLPYQQITVIDWM